MNGPMPDEFSRLVGKKGALFSSIELSRYIEEEERHDHKLLTAHTTQSLRSMSSGERKKALLSYLVASRPDFLLLDNPFDNLDRGSQESLREMLHKLARTTCLILVISRKDDLIPEITNYAILKGNELLMLPQLEQPEKYRQGAARYFSGRLPAPPEPVSFRADPFIEFRNVSVAFDGKPVLKQINWKIRPNEYWELKGKNGSGKTTLLSMITGDNPKGYGQELYIFGNRKGSGESVWDIKKHIGYFSPAMIDRFRGYHSLENMLISGLTDSIGLYVLPTEAQIRMAREWLKLLGLETYAASYFHDLGLGMQRLVMCGRAMIKHPPLLILDEPTAGLDDESAVLFVSLVNKIARESESSIIFVSHRQEAGLEPDAVYELEMTPEGSVGHQTFLNKNPEKNE